MGALLSHPRGHNQSCIPLKTLEFEVADLGVSASRPVLKDLRFHEEKDKNKKPGQDYLRGGENSSYTFHRFLFGLTPDFPWYISVVLQSGDLIHFRSLDVYVPRNSEARNAIKAEHLFFMGWAISKKINPLVYAIWESLPSGSSVNSPDPEMSM